MRTRFVAYVLLLGALLAWSAVVTPRAGADAGLAAPTVPGPSPTPSRHRADASQSPARLAPFAVPDDDATLQRLREREAPEAPPAEDGGGPSSLAPEGGVDPLVSPDEAADIADAAVMPNVLDAGVTAVGPSDASSSTAAPDAGLAGARGHTPGALAADTRFVLRTTLALLALVVLAALFAHPAIRAFEERIGLTPVITAGFPFVALGLLARHPSVGILDDAILRELTPILQFGLGWLGLLVGLQLDVRLLDRAPDGAAVRVGARTGVSFLVVVAATSLAMLAFGEPWNDAQFLRAALVLGAAGAMSAPSVIRRMTASAEHADAEEVRARIEQFDEIAAVVALAFVGAYFRPAGDVAWSLPGTGWLFVTFGLALTFAIVAYGILRRPATEAESLALTLGIVSLGAGLAGYLRLSPIVVCFVVGAFLANFPFHAKREFIVLALRLERPIHLLFLTAVGALWDVTSLRGWILVPVFVVARVAGQWLGDTLVRRSLTARAPARRGAVLTPISVLSMAIVVNAQELFGGAAVRWSVTAVIAGAIVTELLVHALRRKNGAASE